MSQLVRYRGPLIANGCRLLALPLRSQGRAPDWGPGETCVFPPSRPQPRRGWTLRAEKGLVANLPQKLVLARPKIIIENMRSMLLVPYIRACRPPSSFLCPSRVAQVGRRDETFWLQANTWWLFKTMHLLEYNIYEGDDGGGR